MCTLIVATLNGLQCLTFSEYIETKTVKISPNTTLKSPIRYIHTFKMNLMQLRLKLIQDTEKKSQLTVHIECWFLFLSPLGWFLPQSLGTVAWRGSQAIWCCSSVMDVWLLSCSPATKTTSDKATAPSGSPLFLVEVPSSVSYTPMKSLKRVQQLSCILPYQSPLQWLTCPSGSCGPLSVIKDASLQWLMFSGALLEHLKDSDTNTFLSGPFAALPLTCFHATAYCNVCLLRFSFQNKLHDR